MKKIVILSAFIFAFVLTTNMVFARDNHHDDNNNCGSCSQQQKCPCPETNATGITTTVSSNALSGNVKIAKVNAAKINVLTGTAYSEAYGSAAINTGILTGKVTAKNINANVMSSAFSGDITIKDVSAGNGHSRSNCDHDKPAAAKIKATTGASQSLATGYVVINSSSNIID